MRVPPTALLLVGLLAAAGCSADPSGPGSAPPPDPGGPAAMDGAGTGEEATEHTYAVNEQITVDLTMYTNSEGGRMTPFFSGYRPTIEFDYRDQSAECAAQLPEELPEFPPGESHLIGLECDTEVTVHVDTPGFTLLESGTEHGSGEVVLTGEEP